MFFWARPNRYRPEDQYRHGRHLDQAHHKAGGVRERLILSLFEGDAGRFDSFSARLTACPRIFQDQHRCGEPHPAARLAEAAGRGHRAAMFEGEKINNTEDRAVLQHCVSSRPRAKVDGQAVTGVRDSLDRMAAFARACARPHHGCRRRALPTWSTSASWVRPRPAMASRALTLSGRDRPLFQHRRRPYRRYTGWAGPARTLVIIASKTFTTIRP